MKGLQRRCAECDALWLGYRYDDACDKHGGPGELRRAVRALLADVQGDDE